MRKVLLLGLVGCWGASSQKPASPPPSPPAPAPATGASTGGATYGGDAYGGEDDGALAPPAGGPAAGNPVPPVPPVVSIGQPSAGDGLDKAIIRRYFKRNYQKIVHCYEQELAANPSLAGTVTVQFTIGSDGKVTQSAGSGLPPVDACVARVVAAIEFPAPKGGGRVIVNYPLTFRSAAP